MKRSFIFILLNLILTTLQAKTLIIGVMLYNPPFEMRADDKNHFFGFDVDLMNALCREMRVNCQYNAMTFKELFDAVDQKKIDLAIGGFTITQERAQQYLFSLPYLGSNARFATLSTSSISSLKDLKNKTVGTLRASLYPELVEKMFPQTKVIEYATIDRIILALGQKKVDAVIGGAVAVEYWVANNGSIFKIVGGRIPMGSGMGIMANKDETLLIQRVNKALEDIESNGVYLSIYERYFGKDQFKLSKFTLMGITAIAATKQLPAFLLNQINDQLRLNYPISSS